MRSRPGAAGLALSLVATIGMVLAPPARAQAPSPAATPTAPATAPPAPGEIEGRINGKAAHFVSRGDDVLLSASEADRLGIEYRDGKRMAIGGTPLWLVILNSVTVADRTRIGTQAGVVPSIPGYFAALRAHPAEALARSRELQLEINGVQVQGYNLGRAGVLLAFDVADRAGVKYREGKRQDLGFVQAWVVQMLVKVGAEEGQAMVTVAEPEPYFEAMMAAAARGSGASAPR
jgi:hypothetical protein